MQGTGSDFHEVDREFVEGILAEAEEKHLVTRPFRYEKDRTRDQGICFCCDDCCWYLTHLDEEAGACDKGRFIQQTDMDACTHCGDCVDVCYFKVRKMMDDELQVTHDKCAGCGLCFDVCPADCIEMVPRT
jgi:Pyruvate/2-oxoacid:ferredoxin oxidoreductase delta subunit